MLRECFQVVAQRAQRRLRGPLTRSSPDDAIAESWGGPITGGANGKANGAPAPTFPHLRIAGCTSCSNYLIEIDMERDGRAVPEVDELAAVPLDLYAADQGLRKVTPNLMGF